MISDNYDQIPLNKQKSASQSIVETSTLQKLLGAVDVFTFRSTQKES